MYTEALLGLASSLGSAGLAAAAKNMSEEQARAILERARNDYGEIDIPTLEQLAGQTLPDTELSKVQADPKLAQAQYGALSKLEQLGEGGFNVQDEALLNAAMGKVSRQEQAGRSAIQDNMAARGTLGSGAELAMALDNHQSSANRANAVGMDAAARAQSRAYDAILSGGKLAGQMRDQQYNEKANAAKAQDLINRYNGTKTADAHRDRFNMQMHRAMGMNGMNPAVAGSYRNTGTNNANLIAGIGTAANETIAALADKSNKADYDVGYSEDPDQSYEDDYLERMRKQGP